MKTCTKCKKVTDNFGPLKTAKDGLQSWCKSCRAEYGREYKNAHKEESQEYIRKYRKENREAILENTRKYKKENREAILEVQCKTQERDRFKLALRMSKRLSKHHGWKQCNATEDQLRNSFTGFCGICGVPELECSRRLAMDHCHETGRFRGWLCGKCNQALGMFGDSEELLIDALHYVMNSQ